MVVDRNDTLSRDAAQQHLDLVVDGLAHANVLIADDEVDVEILASVSPRRSMPRLRRQRQEVNGAVSPLRVHRH